MGQMKGVINFFIITVLCSIVATSAHGTECGCKQKQVIKFYVHDNLLQKEGNTAYIIAGPGGNITHLQQGSLVAINDLITERTRPTFEEAWKRPGSVPALRFLPRAASHLPAVHIRLHRQVERINDCVPRR